MFLIGFLIGLSHGYPAIALASAAMTFGIFPFWLFRGELALFSVLVWIGYLFALQSGFMLGSYLGMSNDEG